MARPHEILRNACATAKADGAFTVSVPLLESVVIPEIREAQDSDGYHTFDELYRHRSALFLALCHGLAANPYGIHDVWRTKTHSDGTSFPGMFVLGIGSRAGRQITYHMDMEYWERCDWAETLDRAPEFDGHTSEDVIERLGEFVYAL